MFYILDTESKKILMRRGEDLLLEITSNCDKEASNFKNFM